MGTDDINQSEFERQVQDGFDAQDDAFEVTVIQTNTENTKTENKTTIVYIFFIVITSVICVICCVVISLLSWDCGSDDSDVCRQRKGGYGGNVSYCSDTICTIK